MYEKLLGSGDQRFILEQYSKERKLFKVPVTGEVRQRRQQMPEDDFKCASKLGTM